MKYFSDEPTRPPLLRAFLSAFKEEDEKTFCLIKKPLYAHFISHSLRYNTSH